MEKTAMSRAEIENILHSLIKSFGLFPPVSDKALFVQHQHGLYAECVRELLSIMRFDANIRLRMYADHLWPHGDSGAKVNFIDPMPPFWSREFKKLKILVEIRESHLKDYPSFLICMVHEISHIALYSFPHSLRYSEEATDLCIVVFGFGERLVELRGRPGPLGYISEQEFIWAQDYLDRRRKRERTWFWRFAHRWL